MKRHNSLKNDTFAVDVDQEEALCELFCEIIHYLQAYAHTTQDNPRI